MKIRTLHTSDPSGARVSTTGVKRSTARPGTGALFAILAFLLATSLSATAQPYSIWDDTAVPAVASANDPNPVNLGLKFSSAVDGLVTGIRFYKGEANTGIHTGSLWTVDGTLLASVEFQNETATGWQTQALPVPVPIVANTVYVVSYHAPNGYYAADAAYFALGGVDSFPLRALADGELLGNGVYAYGPSGVFPNATYNAANYWVDLVMLPNADQTPPTITCPPNIVLICDGCDIDPANTGYPTVTDESPYTLDYVDLLVVEGCPQLVERTWVATDAAGNSASCLQTLTCLPAALVTDSSGCIFDRDPATSVQDFRLIYQQDPQNWPCYRVVASNPGQFVYNVFYAGTPGANVDFNLILPYPFVTQGANPIHAYDGMSLGECGGQLCVQPGNAFYVGSQQVTLADYGAAPEPFTSIPVSLTVPDSGLVQIAVHLDFGLKRSSGYLRNMYDDALDCATGSVVLIPNHANLEFAVSGAQSGSATIQNINVWKKMVGVAGLVLYAPTLDPVPGASLALYDANRVLVGSAVSDEDGFYVIPYKHKGRAALYSVRMATKVPSSYKTVVPVTIKANDIVALDFLVP